MVDAHCRAALFLACSDAELNNEELATFARAIGVYVGQALALSSAFARVSAAAEAGRILFSSLEIDKTLHALADLVIARMADVCEIDLVEEEGDGLRQAVQAHSDPAKLEVLREMYRRYPPEPERSPRYTVLQTKAPHLVSEISDTMRAEMAWDAEHLRLLKEIGLRSEMIVPLLVQGRALGVLTIGTSRPGRRHGRMDLALAEDLASRASVAIQNARLYEAMEQASRAKDEFLGTVSHELRTPLNAMLGWTRMLRSGVLPIEKHARALESVERNAVAQAQLIEDILDISRIVAGKLHFDLRNVSLVGVVEAALDSVRPSLEAKAIRFEAKITPDITLACDGERLQQVVWNLLSNAIKFTPKGGTISLTIEHTASQVRLTVKDSGQGINPAFLSRIFQRFQQADGSHTRLHGGLGLGLAISRHIVELHGGTIEAESDGDGLGALFCVTLPRSTQKTTPSYAPPPLQRATDTSDVRSELAGLEILIVDDEHDARELFTTVLVACGAMVIVASSAREALSILAESRPHAIVSDLGMPGEDGVSFIRKVRAMKPEDGGTIPAIAVTAYARAEDRESALDAGFQLHIAKPFEPAELVESIATLARMGRLLG
jgi:signal transduction histidine kinase/ActR/RegA family two-component response regulator